MQTILRESRQNIRLQCSFSRQPVVKVGKVFKTTKERKTLRKGVHLSTLSSAVEFGIVHMKRNMFHSCNLVSRVGTTCRLCSIFA